MAIDSILSLIDAEIARLTQARALLARTGALTAKVQLQTAAKPKAVAPVKKHRKISAEGRRRIAEAQKKRWAAAKSKKA